MTPNREIKPIKLLIGSQDASGLWEEIYISRAVDEASSSFTFKATPQSVDGEDLYKRFEPGLLVKVSYGSELLITGYIDTVRNEIDESQHTLTIEGRSKTKDLVDSDVLDSSQFKNQKLSAICNALAAPYKCRVIVPADLDRTVSTFQAKADGETVFEAIERLANETGLNVGDTPEGDLILTFAGSKKSQNKLEIRWGHNTGIKSYAHTKSEANKYSEIRVTGQAKTTDNFHGKKAAQILEKAIDPDSKRQRVKLLRADTSITREKAIEKAMAELQASHAKSNEINVTVFNWQGTKELWREGTNVEVVGEVTGSTVSGEWVIARAEFSISSSNGTTTQLTLNPPYAFKKPAEDGKLKVTKSKRPAKKAPKKEKKAETQRFWQEGDPV